MYHIQVPLDGLFLLFSFLFFKLSILPSIIISILFVYLSGRIKYLKQITLSCFLVFLLFFTYLVFRLPVNRAILKENEEKFYENNYINPDKINITFKQKRNIVILSLESIERSYNEINKQLIPNLIKLENENLSFNGYSNIIGTNFTIGSQFGIMCGVGLLGGKISASFSKNRNFMPNITCISDILEENGYDIYQIQTGKVEFSGTDKFAKEHHFANIVGGFKGDKEMYEAVKEFLINKEKNKPYFLWLSTMDTHDPIDSVDDIIKADNMANDFVKWYRNFDAESILVIVGDHHMRGTENEIKKEVINLPKEKRSVVNVIINSVISTANIDKNRKFTFFDFFPTIIESIGGVIEGRKLGLGTSLYSGQPTLIEQIGESDFNVKSCIGDELYKSFFRDR
jgi:phosphoglycerol transferase